MSVTTEDLDRLQAERDAAHDALEAAKTEWATAEFTAAGIAVGDTFTRQERWQKHPETWQVVGNIWAWHSNAFSTGGVWGASIKCRLLTRSGEPHRGRDPKGFSVRQIAESKVAP